MSCGPTRLLLLSLFICAVTSAADRGSTEKNVASNADGIEFFEKKIRPALAQYCYECHSHNSKKLKAELYLDSRQGMLHGGESGVALVLGEPDKSRMIEAVRYTNPDIQMPPKRKLPDNVVADLVEWVKMGAPWPAELVVKTGTTDQSDAETLKRQREHWSWQPIKDSPPPTIHNTSWPRNSVDHFILAKLEENKLTPASPADKRTLIRRAYFDSLGLPPTPDEVESFLRDDSPDAFAKVVDHLLASPHYGERYARHWLDVARYGEDQAHSFQPRLYPNGFRYRDWVAKSFNDDLPYDQFIKEQIAADLLDAPNKLDRLPALGFSAVGPVYYGDRQMHDQYADRIDTLTRGFLGLTVACARCHDHKYDPISQNEYYALTGVFASTAYHEVPIGTAEEIKKYDDAQAAITAKTKQIDTLLEEEAKKLNLPKNQVERKLSDEQKATLKTWRKELDDLKKDAPKKYPVIHALKEAEKCADVPVLLRGNSETPGEPAKRRFLSILTDGDPKPFQTGSGRLELANAIADRNNPLTARVMVNRIWQYHFGKGLVRTPSNFGLLGEPPSHPDLLDYLSARFIDSGWSIKSLHRLIMLSSAYQQSTQTDARSLELDADNRLLSRMNRRRLEVEAWRDAMLAVSGQLDRTIGGPSTPLSSPDNRRRTFYASVSRHDLDSLLRLFDFPDPNVTTDTRTITTVPLQQLFVLNGDFLVDQAKSLASRLTTEYADSDSTRITRAFLLTYSRPPTQHELQLALSFLHENSPDTNTSLSRWAQYTQALLAANEFMYID